MKTIKLTLCALSVAVFTGCATHLRYDNSVRLMDHPEFEAAAKAAPGFVEDALLTVNFLEYELERQ